MEADINTERIDELLEESETDDEMVGSLNPQQSSSSEAYRQRRTIMTPSPIGTENDSTSEEDVQQEELIVKDRSRKKTSSKRKAPEPKPSISKKKAPEPKPSTSKRSNPARGKNSTNYEEIGSSDGSGDEDDPPSKATKRAKNFQSSNGGDRNQAKKRKTNHNSAESDNHSQTPPLSQLSQSQDRSFPGVLKSLHLQNFMCHSNFSFDFHRNLNFITGQNGSGKSALLSGILIALGGKATATSRTSSIKSLIQKGKTTARVSVTLLNKNGLRKYGDEITVERWMNISGSGGYRIKSIGGEGDTGRTQWRPLKRHELDNILLGLNIQIDNPVAILNQEVARSFLRSKDPKVKFNLFYEGTLLKKLDTIREDTQAQLDAADAILENQRTNIGLLKAEVSKLKAKVSKITELNLIKAELGKIHHAYLWSLVIEQEEVCDELKNSIAKANEEIRLLEEKLHETEVGLANLSEESIAREQTEVRETLKKKKEQAEKIRVELVQLKNSTMQLRMKIKSAAGTVASKESQISKLEAQIERVKAEQDAKEQEESSRDQEQLEQLQTERKNLESSVNSIKGDADNFQLSADREREKLEELEITARGVRSQIEMKKRNINALSKRANKYAVFGPKMEQLMAKIQANVHKFRKPPRGPLGACFSVKDPEYAVLVEAILYNNLDSFVVDNARDLSLLREYMDSIFKEGGATQRSGRPSGVGSIGNKKPGIIMMPFAEQMYDVSSKLSVVNHPSAHNLFELLEVENNDHVVMNTLIDIAEVEKILLFADSPTASRVLKNESTLTRAMKCAFTLTWYRFTPAPAFAARVMKQKSRAEFVKSGRNREAEKEVLLSEIRQLETELKNLEPQRAEIREQQKSFRLTYDEKVNEIGNIRRQIGELSNEIKRQQNKISQRNKRCDLSSYYEELEELRDEVKTQSAIRDTATKEFEEVKPNILELEAKKAKLDRELEKLNTEMSGFQESREKLKTKREEVANLIKRFKAKISSLNENKVTATKTLQSKTSILQQKKKSAVEAGAERIDTGKTPSQLRKEFEELKVRITESEAQLGNVDDLRRKLVERRTTYINCVADYKPLSRMHGILSNMFEDQKATLIKTKSQVGRTLTIFYQAMAKQRGYEGRLILDYSTKELYYFVCPDGHSFTKTLNAIDAQQLQSQSTVRTPEQIKQSKNLKKTMIEYSLGLSGGERSFATICFVMALWQVMECPFYMLDEFDVFMDAFNRKTSQIALMAHARKFNMNQFVLFTPLDIGDIPKPEDARVLRLFPPVRDVVSKGNARSQASPDDVEDDGEDIQLVSGRISDSSSVENVDPRGNSPSRSQKAPLKSVQNARKRRQPMGVEQ